MNKICDFGKEIKKRLIDIDHTQEWLISEVRKDTGLFFDSSYLYKIMSGRQKNPTITNSIKKILHM